MRALPGVLLLAAFAVCPTPGNARNILITNDDGLSSNVKALYEVLKANGDDVIVSVPCANQSGMSAAIRFMVPLGPLQADCKNGAAKAGDPGAGPLTKAGFTRDFYYVDGTPVMAMLYGLDVVAVSRWGRPPDLVLSGPNEGQNVGSIVLTSGTVSNAQVAGSRGIPAIALSAGFGTIDDRNLASPESAKVALLTAKLIEELDAVAKSGEPIPQGVALNVNFPDRLEGAKWRLTRIGSYNSLKVRFVTDLAAASPIGPARQPLPHAPGVTVSLDTSPPRADEQQDESVVNRRDITVTPMQIGFDQDVSSSREWLEQRLRLLNNR
jgi:5'-nucleotidase